MLKYFQILGLSEKASLNDIKKAYRRLVVLYHPDKNKEPGAAEKFIEITEAYEMLIDFKVNGPKRKVSRTISREEIIRQQKEEARRKAMWAANQRYTEYLKSEAYLTNQAYSIVIDHVLFVITLFFVFVLPVYLFMRYGATGLISGIIVALVTGPFSIPAFRNIRRFSPERFWQALLFSAKTKLFWQVVLPPLNIIVFLKIGLQTLMPFSFMMMCYIILVVFFFLLASVFKSGKYTRLRVLAAFQGGPFVMTVFLLLNFFISFHPVAETYRIVRSRGNDNFVLLEGKAYREFPGIRAFMDTDEPLHSRKVTYVFKTGMFGVRVMQRYYFDLGYNPK